MHWRIRDKKIVFETPWFGIEEKSYEGMPRPYYSVVVSDYVSVVPVRPDGNIVLVRQFRQALDDYTLEFPSGHVEPGQTPEEAGRIELAEETASVASSWEPLGALRPDTGRLSNKIWGYLATGVAIDPALSAEEGIESVIVSPVELKNLIQKGGFANALHVALFGLCLLKDKFQFR